MVRPQKMAGNARNGEGNYRRAAPKERFQMTKKLAKIWVNFSKWPSIEEGCNKRPTVADEFTKNGQQRPKMAKSCRPRLKLVKQGQIQTQVAIYPHLGSIIGDICPNKDLRVQRRKLAVLAMVINGHRLFFYLEDPGGGGQAGGQV